jgi:coenzyme F420-0:L-glutamate ligase/coenzyme F420-1:gamma-L-glutamate ligase
MDLRGRSDLFGHELRVTETGFADEIASAASLIKGQANEGQPVVLVRGLSWAGAATPGASLLRTPEEDLFR